MKNLPEKRGIPSRSAIDADGGVSCTLKTGHDAGDGAVTICSITGRTVHRAAGHGSALVETLSSRLFGIFIAKSLVKTIQCISLSFTEIAPDGPKILLAQVNALLQAPLIFAPLAEEDKAMPALYMSPSAGTTLVGPTMRISACVRRLVCGHCNTQRQQRALVPLSTKRWLIGWKPVWALVVAERCSIDVVPASVW